jgi:formylglycine-generating enzyme required for sulfatase activity
LDRVRSLFERALALPSAQWDAFVRDAAGEDTELVTAVLALLRAGDAGTKVLRHAARRDDVVVAAAATPRGGQDQVEATATADLLLRLGAAPRLDPQRFTIEAELGRGGMGVVWRTFDHVLHRRLAMKVLRERDHPGDEAAPQLAHQLLGRFLEEAQVTSQLDHPGVVPVHDLGFDAAGKVWFTMRMVKGRTASEVFADAQQGRDHWTTTRALEVMLKVCDTMAYAHQKGVVHRDLKPSNVMVGRFGEVYVMDWGLAKVLGQQDRHDLRIRPESALPPSSLATVRRTDAAADVASSVVSMDGQQLGTPSYMPPEQARSEALDRRADVYAIGAMTYELLTGRAPYTTPGHRKPPYRILDDVLDGPPKRIEELAPATPAELVSIVEKAMARDPAARYPGVVELAADLRAYVDGRVVQAHRTGALVEMRLWMRRNRAFAVTLVTAAVLQAAGIVGALTLWYWAEHHKAVAIENNRLLGLEAARNRIFSDVAKLAEAKRLEAELHPPVPELVPPMAAWLQDFGEPLAARLPALAAELAALRATARPVAAARAQALPERDPRWAELQHRKEQLQHESDPHLRSELAAAVAALETEVAIAGIEFADARDDLLHRTLTRLVADQDQFVNRDQLPRVRRRLAAARTVKAQTIDSQQAQWDAAAAAIRASDGVQASTAYGHYQLSPQLGLVPIGRDPESRLWEFVHLASGTPGKAIPARDAATGRLLPTADMGLVFVLLPGGRLPAPGAGDAQPGELHRQSVHLDPFLLSKYEMTQGQWLRLVGSNPSHTRGDGNLLLPVEQVDWFECEQVCRHQGLQLPTELQWEYAIRAGSTTKWWTGDTAAGLRAMENIQAAARLLPVGSKAPNPFGLFDMGGNLWEWCADAYSDYGTERAGDGLRPVVGAALGIRCIRGGGFGSEVDGAQSASRGRGPSLRDQIVGVRPARAL